MHLPWHEPPTYTTMSHHPHYPPSVFQPLLLQLEEEAEGNLEQCLLLQSEVAKAKASLAALETETSHR